MDHARFIDCWDINVIKCIITEMCKFVKFFLSSAERKPLLSFIIEFVSCHLCCKLFTFPSCSPNLVSEGNSFLLNYHALSKVQLQLGHPVLVRETMSVLNNPQSLLSCVLDMLDIS